jgi:hypothetical protein
VISKTPVVSSGEANVKLAFHLSNLPAIFTDDPFTSNFIELCTGTISKIGASARLHDGNTVNTKRQRIADRKRSLPKEEQHDNIAFAEAIARGH